MNRTTIDYGIDLGTTNSEIAVLKGTEIEVFKNNEGVEFTPSAVWIDRKNTLYVGRRAKERVEDDPENAFCEFKLQMGSGREYVFARSGRRMTPEALSAEVLKELKSYILKRTGEDIKAAVITVPAAFEAPQCEATRRAAQAAGFIASPLLLEPVAAAQAYGFDSTSDKVFWLVFDFGGGTFDAALIQLRDGIIQVVNHGGDNFLGGKLIDWAIVDQLLIPAVTKEHTLTDFRRGSPRWGAAMAKLKWHAELAKIRASADPSAEIIIDFLCQDDRGEPVRFEYDLKREEVQRLATPFFLRAINICRQVLTEKRLSSGHVEKIVLVGGPTQMPMLRDLLVDAKEGLGIPLEFRVDPLTVVARGAAVFARTQRMPEEALGTVTVAGRYQVKLEYTPAGSDLEPPVSGLVKAPDGASLNGVTLELINLDSRPPWRSGKLPLSPSGAFMTTVLAEKAKLNTFSIELYDATGSKRETVPDHFPYTFIKNVVDDQILIHSLGVVTAKSETEFLLEKGQRLPAKKRAPFQTAFAARAGQAGAILRIPVVEGERVRADRNRYIGSLEVLGHQLKRDLPAGVDVEITMEVNEPGLIRTKAFIPFLDEEFEAVLTGKSQPKPEDLRRDVESERKRLAEARNKAHASGDPKANAVLERIGRERMESEIDSALAAYGQDPDAADKTQNRLLDLKVAVDEIEDSLKWPSFVAETEQSIKELREFVEPRANQAQKQSFGLVEAEAGRAITQRDADLLKSKLEELRTLASQIGLEDYPTLVAWFLKLASSKSQMTDLAQADQWITQGQRAINSNDKTSLQSAVIQLSKLCRTGGGPVDSPRKEGPKGDIVSKDKG